MAKGARLRRAHHFNVDTVVGTPPAPQIFNDRRNNRIAVESTPSKARECGA
jgi:hypothetical protein